MGYVPSPAVLLEGHEKEAELSQTVKAMKKLNMNMLYEGTID